MSFYLEISCRYTPVAMRLQFASGTKAHNARRKLAKEMGKGTFRNDSPVVEIKGDTGAISVNAGEVMMVQVVDAKAWDAVAVADAPRHPSRNPVAG